MNKTKSFDIPKKLVFEAFKVIKANKGAAGIDDISLEKFEEKLKVNLYKIWNRMFSGTYFPPPVKGVEIPKKNGGIRVLGIPTVSDRIAQMVVKLTFENKVEKYFLEDSYGYRPNKSAHDAIDITRKRCWKYNWVLEFDIKGLFDNINHELLTKAVEKHTKVPWEILYIKRWMKVPLKKGNTNIDRVCGVPQGGVISPVLANLFLHYTFDKWMKIKFTNNPWCRYADDGIIHCKTLNQAQYIMKCLKKRLEECKLEMHPEKTKIIYCKDSNRMDNYSNIEFTFLGYTFRPRKAKGNNVQFTSFLPAISNKSKTHIKQSIRGWRLLWMTNKQISDIAQKYNPIILGWLNYYGKYGKRELARVLEHINYHLYIWVKRKYKKYKHKPNKAMKCLTKIANKNPLLFHHWKVGILPMTRKLENEALKAAIIRIYKANKGIYGAPRIHHILGTEGFNVFLKRVQRRMKDLDLCAITVKKYKTHSNKKVVEGLENVLKRDFTTTSINEKWVVDITYIHTIKDGWCYLASILDLHSKKIIGYAFGKRMTNDLVVKALKNAHYNQSPDKNKQLIFHTDLGSQYTSNDLKEICRELNITQSFSKKGCPYDNACIESFHSSIKKEEIYRNTYRTFEEANIAIFKYIEAWHNRKRLHFSINYMTPDQCELLARSAA